jgi:hypothetical protein
MICLKWKNWPPKICVWSLFTVIFGHKYADEDISMILKTNQAVLICTVTMRMNLRMVRQYEYSVGLD